MGRAIYQATTRVLLSGRLSFTVRNQGISAKTLSVHVAIAAWPWGAYLGSEGLEKGHSCQDILVLTSSCERQHCRAKSVTTANSLAHLRGGATMG
jgi:branched-chain amino acid aminotransferase